MRHRGQVTTLLRTPVWLRTFLVVFIVVYLGVIGFLAVSSTAGSRVVLAACALGGAGLTYRVFRLGVVGDAEQLVVRNQLRTLTYARADVEQFRTGKPVGTLSFSRSIYALTRSDGAVALDVSTRPTVLARSRQRMHEDLESCERWRSAEP